MTLGIWQRETLDKFAETLKRSLDVVRLQIVIDPPRPYTREFGKGRVITIQAYERYEEGEYKFGYCTWIADCQHEHTAIEKGREIAGYLVAARCPKEHIKLGMRQRFWLS